MRKRGSQKLALTTGITVPAASEFHQPATALLQLEFAVDRRAIAAAASPSNANATHYWNMQSQFSPNGVQLNGSEVQ